MQGLAESGGELVGADDHHGLWSRDAPPKRCQTVEDMEQVGGGAGDDWSSHRCGTAGGDGDAERAA